MGSGAGASTCDAVMTSVVGSGSGHSLEGEDFSSAYNCASKSDAIKGTVNIVANYGCCGGNSNGKAILVLVLLII